MTIEKLRRFAVMAAMVCGILGACVARAQDQPSNAEPCVDRLEPGAASAPRLPNVSYECMRLSNGRHVLVMQSGSATAPVVLLVHGLGDNAHRDWRGVVPTLSPNFRVIALDLPGFGASQSLPQSYTFDLLSAVLLEVMDRMQVTRAHVVGHSLGGALSLHFADDHPARVDRLVLIDAAGILHKTMYVRHMASVELPSIGVNPVDRWLSALDRQINNLSNLMFKPLDSGFDFSRWLTETPSVRYALLGRYTQVDAAIGLIEHDFGGAIASVAAPTTLIWGRDDAIAPLRTGELLAARMRDARLHVIDGVGHVPMTGNPQRLHALLLSALTEPLGVRFDATPLPTRNGDVECNARSNAVFSGQFDTLTLKRCPDVRIDRARIGRLVMESSNAVLSNSQIVADDVALTMTHSRLRATAVDIRGATAITALSSDLDLAGVRVEATKQSLVTEASHVFFSVSDVRAPDFTGSAHFIWAQRPQAPAGQR